MPVPITERLSKLPGFASAGETAQEAIKGIYEHKFAQVVDSLGKAKAHSAALEAAQFVLREAMETSTGNLDGSKEIQAKNWTEKCPDCGAVHVPTKACPAVVEDENGDEDNAVMGATYESDDPDVDLVDEAELGFKKLENKLAHKKGIYDPAGLAAAIGRKKYGSKGFSTHKHVDESEALISAAVRQIGKQ